ADSLGNYRIRAKVFDTVMYSLLGYQNDLLPVSKEMWGNIEIDIYLKRSVMTMEEVLIVAPLIGYQADSLDRREVFGQQVDDKRKRATLNTVSGAPSVGFGLTIDAPITSIIHKYAPKYKRKCKFQERFQKTEEQLFVDTKYNPQIVEQLTELDAESELVYLFL